MSFTSLAECLDFLENNGELVRIKSEVDPNLEMAQIHRRVFEMGGPALLFENVKGSPFRSCSNIFGTMNRCEMIFEKTFDDVKQIVRFKADPLTVLKKGPSRFQMMFTAKNGLPRKVSNRSLTYRTTITQLPQIRGWPDDGGAYIFLPQVFTEDPTRPGIARSNLGMYRVQLSGNDYTSDKEVGLHYQIHRGIAAHHQKSLTANKRLRVSIFVGGPPAHSLAAVFPLPEDVSELHFAGMLAGKRFAYAREDGFVISTDADFCITGYLTDELKMEGPFGDHLGYYSNEHMFPVMKVENVYHKKDAIWPFTVVGRPPQEDSNFGRLIHQLVGPMIPKSIPGLKALNAVDEAGVHPLLLARAEDRYTPYEPGPPKELLTIGNAILGFNQTSLAKYLFIAEEDGSGGPDVDQPDLFLNHVLSRVNLQRDLHFQTNTTIDTLDYSGSGLNAGSKLVIAVNGPQGNVLKNEIPKGLVLPDVFAKIKLVQPGILALQGPSFSTHSQAEKELSELAAYLDNYGPSWGWPLVVLCDDSSFAAASFKNFLWVTFTRSNPSHDLYGIQSSFTHKHWGCEKALIIDARLKPHHAKPLIENEQVVKRVDELFSADEGLSRL